MIKFYLKIPAFIKAILLAAFIYLIPYGVGMLIKPHLTYNHVHSWILGICCITMIFAVIWVLFIISTVISETDEDIKLNIEKKRKEKVNILK